MRFSVFLNNMVRDPAQEQFQETIEQIELTEELGFYGLWFGEHHFTSFGRPSVAPMAAYALARTQRVVVGSSVVVLPVHHPIQVAEDWATLDQLGRGRVRFGFGRGTTALEFEGMDVPMSESGPRTDEAYEIIRRAWTDETISYDGRFWRIPKTSVFPRPFQKPHPPLWRPAVRRATINWLVKQGVNGHVGPFLMPLDILKEKYWDHWHAAKAEAVRPELQCAVTPVLFVGETDRDVRRAVEEPLAGWIAYIRDMLAKSGGATAMAHWQERICALPQEAVLQELTLCGTPEQVSEKVRFIKNEGRVDEFILWTAWGGIRNEDAQRSMRLFAEEVIPAT